jgi:glycolate dehydrogenase FAD-binding subunit
LRTVQPADAEDAARTLADGAKARERIAIEGGGTKSGWNPSSRDAHIVLSTRRLNRVIAHRHGDLTATVEAGATLDDVNRALGRHGQWIPLDPPWSDHATIGGIVATNDAGPRRHRYGTPRDLIIGIEIARADGTRAKAGGIVVKNVAGYDLARLMTGSFGSLGLILNATFKLYPLPPASRTVVAELPTHAAAGVLVDALNASQLTPTAIEIETAPLRLLIRFESTERSVEHQAETTLRHVQMAGARAHTESGELEQHTWNAHVARPWTGRGVIARMTLLPAQLAKTLDAIGSAAGEREWEATGRAGTGVLLLRLDGDAARAVRIIEHLRERFAPGEGNIVILRWPEELSGLVDAWGTRGDAFGMMQAVKRAFDPLGILPPLG